MKKRLAALFCATLAASMILVGCQASKGLETDNLKITQYKGVEVSAVSPFCAARSVTSVVVAELVS